MTAHPTAGPPERLDAAYHLLDRQILDRRGRCVAKVDDLEVIEGADGRLFVTALLIGPAALGPRLGGRLGAATAAVWRRLCAEQHPLPGRIGIEEITGVGSAIHVAGTRAELDVEGFERWVDAKVVSRLPLVRGSGPALGEPRQPQVPAVDPDRVRRMNDLLSREVRDRRGQALGRVSDVRLRTNFHNEGSRWRTTQLEVTDLIVNQRALASLLGYERRHDQGPWLLRVLLRRFRPPSAACLPWERADLDWAEHHVTSNGERLDEFRL